MSRLSWEIAGALVVAGAVMLVWILFNLLVYAVSGVCS